MTKQMLVSEDQVRHVAHLARLTLTSDEVATLSRELSAILAYARKLQELDTAGVAPTAHAVELPTRWRPDVVTGDGLSADRRLRGAPEPIGDGFGVPKMVE